jgi:hypothetical protein
MCIVPALEIDFIKGSTRRYRSVLHRADGVEIELDGGSYNKIGGPWVRCPTTSRTSSSRTSSG